MSRLIAPLAADTDDAVAAIRADRATARERAWGHAGVPRQDGLVVIDLDATLVTAHSDKESAAPTWKKDLRVSSAAVQRRPRRVGHRGRAGRAAARG